MSTAHEPRSVAVIGAGLMGHSLAVVFAIGGWRVILQDITEGALTSARRLISSVLQTLREAAVCDHTQALAAERSIVFTTDLANVAESDLIIEAIPEQREAKRSLFLQLDSLIGAEAIIASNTSFLNVFELLPARRQKYALIAHWYSPPHILDLVEIVPGPETAPEVVDRVNSILLALGKKPIVMREFIHGFIANRLQAALNLEVYFLLDNGYATAQEIDSAIKHGLALRMPILGHLMKADFTGLGLVQRSLANRTYAPPPVRGESDALNALLSAGHTGVMSGRGFYDYGGRSPAELFRERDRRLLALKKLISEWGDI